MTVSISRNREEPQSYKCDNFEHCGTSSSHDPEYVGWLKVGSFLRFCSAKCASEYEMETALNRLRNEY